MDLGIRDRVAIVCAASRGLGKAAAAGLAREGARVVLCSREQARLESAASEIRAAAGSDAAVLACLADLSRDADIVRLVDTAVQHFGRLDILINNAGGPPVGTFPGLDDGAWQQGVELTLLSTIRCIRAVLPHMLRQRWGRIVNITSIAARQPVNDLIISSTLRPGILGLSKILANQYGREGILVNCVTPGFILTDRQKEISASRAATRGIPVEQYIAELSGEIPLQRLGRPEELADVIVFLASERAGYVTGAAIGVDGGLSKGLLS
ncbi:MAG: 3-oxoacyl-ACP reductase [Bradyrhizobiaceae bacterium]|nr:MAG: 3-oxoacyl-ACP reductase [Bradyrhizobiaceae bacterium]